MALFIFLAIVALSLFSFLAVASWAGSRRDERSEYYKADMMKKIAELGGERNPALEYLREQQRIASVKRLGGFKLGGLINVGVGLALMIFLRALTSTPPFFLTGLIPVFIGLALLAYAFWFAPERLV